MTKQTEQKIVDSALKLFAEKGYKGATTSDIARNAGVSELTIFRKFETKENLFDETLIYSQEKMKKRSKIDIFDLRFSGQLKRGYWSRTKFIQVTRV